jgi:dihydroorotase
MRTVLLLLVSAALFAQTQYDMLLKGGRVIDPKNSVDGAFDVAIKDGRVAAVAAGIPAASARRVLDVNGLIITPGLVDIHTHLFYTTGLAGAWAGESSIRPDDLSFRSCVTTMADAGSAGWRNFEEFQEKVIGRARTHVLAFINISGRGMISNQSEQDTTEMKPEEVARLARKYPSVVVGVKTAHYEAPDWTAVDRAVEAGELSKLPVMVDFGYFRPERPYWQLVTEKLRPGDISTHAFRATVPWVDENGKLYAYLGEARARGVLFDVGHGGGSFAWRNAVPAIAQGFYPDSISTDLHTGSMNAAMMDLPTTMSKFLAMGMSLRDVVKRTTWKPAQILRHPEFGHLTPGATADIAAFRVLDGDFSFADTNEGLLRGRQRISCELTLLGGQVAWDWNARLGVDYKTLGPAYGVRPGEAITPPPRK